MRIRQILTGCVRPVLFLLIASAALSGCLASREAAGPTDPLNVLLAPPAWPEAATHDAPRIDTDALAQRIHTRVNEVRARHGLHPLAWAPPLAKVARAHSRDMAEFAYFGHTNLRGQDPADRARQAGYATQVQIGAHVLEGIGENLFLTHHYRQYQILHRDDGTRSYMFDWKTLDEIARQAVESWMLSPTHRANVLSPFYHAEAIGVVHGANETLYVTQNFSCQADGLAHARRR